MRSLQNPLHRIVTLQEPDLREKVALVNGPPALYVLAQKRNLLMTELERDRIRADGPRGAGQRRGRVAVFITADGKMVRVRAA